MADLNITADFTEVNNLNTALKSTGSLFVKVVDSLVREESRAKRVTKKLAETTQANLDLIDKAEAITAAKVQQETDKREKARTREATRAEKDAKRIVDANDKIAKAEAKLAAEVARNQAASAQRSTAGLNQRLGVTGTSATGSGAAFGALEGEIERLRLKYDQIYSSSQLYEKSLMELNRANMLGVTSAKQHESAVESLNQEYQNFQNGIGGVGNRFSQHVNQTSDGMNKFGVAAQQTGYQVSDFIVQVQGGTNPLVAFSQQATQLAGLLYLLPPALQASRIGLLGFSISLSTAFAGVTILIPLLAMLAMTFASSGKDAKSGVGGITTLSGALQALTSEIERNQEAFLKLKFNTESAGVASASQQIQDLKAQIPLVRAELDAFYLAVAQGGGINLGAVFGDEGTVLQENLDSLEAQLETLEAQAEAQRMLNGGLSVAAGLQKAAVDATVIRLRLEKESSEKLLKATADQLSYMGRTKQESDNFVASLASAYALLASSHVAASGIADQMARAANAWVASNSVGGAAYMANQYSLYGEGRVSGEKLAKESGALYGGVRVIPSPTVVGTGGSAGGGGGGGETRDVIADFQKQLDLERELLGTSEAYQKVRQALGDDFKTTSPAIVAGLIQQATETQRLIDLDNQRKDLLGTVKSAMEDTLMSIVDGTKSAKEAFKSMAAEIIKELYRVLVVKKLVESVSGFFSPAPAGSVAPPPRPPGLATGGSMMANRTYMVGENGPELVIPRHSGTVVNAKQTAGNTGGGSITVQNNITVTGSDSAMVRTEIAKMIPQITNATKAAVIDARLRGGQMKQAFR